MAAQMEHRKGAGGRSKLVQSISIRQRPARSFAGADTLLSGSCGSGDCRMSRCRCRFCGTELVHTFADLGMTPLSNSFLNREQLNQMEPFYPLHARVCERCFLVQIEEFESPEHIFN